MKLLFSNKKDRTNAHIGEHVRDILGKQDPKRKVFWQWNMKVKENN